MMTLGEFAPSMRCAAFDFDGVFTDNAVYVDQDGCESVRCSRSDGMGLAMLKNRGIVCVVISTEENPVVSARCQKLRLDCLQGCADKVAALGEYLDGKGIAFSETSFLGNDINDLDVLARCGFPAAVADAYPSVLTAVAWTGTRPGGHGAVREFCEVVNAALPDSN